MEKIMISKNPNGYVETAKKDVTFDEFHKANAMHIGEVWNVMSVVSELLENQARNHDWTKMVEAQLYYENFLSSVINGTDFTNEEWYQLHIHNEKHHPLSHCHDDVNLLDIIEMIADNVCSAKARGDKIEDLKIPEDILNLALKNTVKLINDITDTE